MFWEMFVFSVFFSGHISAKKETRPKAYRVKLIQSLMTGFDFSQKIKLPFCSHVKKIRLSFIPNFGGETNTFFEIQNPYLDYESRIYKVFTNFCNFFSTFLQNSRFVKTVPNSGKLCFHCLFFGAKKSKNFEIPMNVFDFSDNILVSQSKKQMV